MKNNTAFALLLIFIWNCTAPEKQETDTTIMDPHSFSKPSEAAVTHLTWKAAVDFQKRIIHATASWQIKVAPDADIIVLDTKGLDIRKVTLDDGKPAEYRLADPDSILGRALAILIRPNTKQIHIEYDTSPDGEAVQWLEPSQTAAKKNPFLFTQSQAILARSWLPCQDSPGVRFTYDADVTVPPNLLALMSASNPQKKNASGVYHFEMKQPISSYLFALAVGDVEFKQVSERSGVYAESLVADTAVWEFADLEKMIQEAESLYGKYTWERYDVIVLPPSFPFGGMENPRLTFATPTILAGDRSLTSLIAHELAHSWSGNLVTNATWNDFWLNEGFTVYFEHRIMEKLYGKDYSEMLATLALQDLRETIKTMDEQHLSADTKLKLDLEGRSPDDGVTDIAYNKGYFFLRLIEEKYGRDKFDAFLKDYFSSHAFTSIGTDAFIKTIKEFYQTNSSTKLDDTLFNEWIFSEGLPANCPQPVSEKFKHVDDVLRDWKNNKVTERKVSAAWSTHEWLHFLKNLPDPLNQQQLAALDKFGNFTNSGNAEIITAWLVKAIRNQYTPAYPKLEQFLIHTGRRKFLTPLYTELMKTPEGKKEAIEVYSKARPNYHFVATNTLDNLVHE